MPWLAALGRVVVPAIIVSRRLGRWWWAIGWISRVADWATAKNRTKTNRQAIRSHAPCREKTGAKWLTIITWGNIVLCAMGYTLRLICRQTTEITPEGCFLIDNIGSIRHTWNSIRQDCTTRPQLGLVVQSRTLNRLNYFVYRHLRRCLIFSSSKISWSICVRLNNLGLLTRIIQTYSGMRK